MKKKSLSAKKVILNSFNFKEILKDKKIFKIYKDFEKNLESLNYTNKIAVSISGGPDSMALSFLVSCYKSAKNNVIQPLFYLVDHGLRKNSAKEAIHVKKELKLKKINLKILKWKGKKPHSNLQSKARQSRYALLFSECKKYKIKSILTAHHQDDLYETFFSRLLRGSGTEGLSSFIEIEKQFVFNAYTITVARPLLNISKEDLIYIAKKVFNFYVIDPSNDMEQFQRVRLRKIIFNLKNQGLDFNKLKLTINNLAFTNKAIAEITEKNISENVTLINKKYILNKKFFSYPEEVIFRSVSIILKKLNNKYYPPRGRKLHYLVKQLIRKDQFKGTLGGAIIEKIHNSVIVSKE